MILIEPHTMLFEVLLYQWILFNSVWATTNGYNYVKCEAPFKQLYTTQPAYTMMSTEIPTDSSSFGLASSIYPCLDLMAGHRYAWFTAGIYTVGKYSTEICTESCLMEVTTGATNCGTRRPPMKWAPSPPGTDKINCSELNLPISENGWKQQTVVTYQESYGKETMAPEALDYIVSKPWTGIKIMEYNKKKTISDFVSTLITKVPTIKELYITSVQSDLSFLWPLLEGKSFETISIDTVSLPSLPEFSVDKLKALKLRGLGLKKFPDWLKNATQLQYLSLEDTGLPKGLENLNNLPDLEHFVMFKTDLTTVPSDFLSSSSKLISLDLTCNRIQSFPEGMFQRFPEIQYLSLGGNLISTLSSTELAPLKKLSALDIRKQIAGRSSGILSLVHRFTNYYFCRTPYSADKEGLSSFSHSLLPNPSSLISLELSGQNGIKLAANAFAKFSSLRLLNLGYSNITSIEGVAVEKLCNLVYCNLEGNNLESPSWLPKEVATSLPRLKKMGLRTAGIISITPELLTIIRSGDSLGNGIIADITLSSSLDNCGRASLSYGFYGITPIKTSEINDNCLKQMENVKAQSEKYLHTKFSNDCEKSAAG